MCLAAIAIGQSDRWPLVIASNRDEYFNRPSAAAHWWRDDSANSEGETSRRKIFAGRDLQAGGTWFGLSFDQTQQRALVRQPLRWALVTNFRQGQQVKAGLSRGAITQAWLEGKTAQSVQSMVASSGPGNWLLGSLFLENRIAHQVFYLNHIRSDSALNPLPSASYRLSNGLLGDPWPKANRLEEDLRLSITDCETIGELVDRLFAGLRRDASYPDAELPETGVPIELERTLSPAFISANLARWALTDTPMKVGQLDYGTRASSVLIIDADLNLRFVERSWDFVDRDRYAERQMTIPLLPYSSGNTVS